MTRLALLLLLAGCVRSNDRLVEDLERLARAAPDPALDAVIDGEARMAPLLQTTSVVVLPMGKGTLPTVRGRVDGHDLSVLLDTGSSFVFLSGEAARRVRPYLPEREAERAVSPGFDARYRPCVFRKLELGAARFGAGLAAVPLREAGHHSLRGAYAIAGCSVLAHFRLRFDFVRRRVVLDPHGQPVSPRMLFSKVRIDGRDLWMLVDSGAARLFLEPWAATELGLLTNEEADRYRRKSSVYGRMKTGSVKLDRVEVAGHTFRDVRAGVVHTFGKEISVDGARAAGLLGLAGFGPHVWTVDFARRRIVLEE